MARKEVKMNEDLVFVLSCVFYTGKKNYFISTKSSPPQPDGKT